MRFTIILSFFLLVFISKRSHSQVSSIEDFGVSFNSVVNPVNNMDTMLSVKYTFRILDTTKVIKIHVRVGTTDGGSDIFNQVILYPNPNGLSNNQQFFRQGSIVEFTIGRFHILSDYFYEIQAEGLGNQMSQKRSYHFH